MVSRPPPRIVTQHEVGIKVYGLRFGVWGYGFGVKGSGLKVRSLGVLPDRVICRPSAKPVRLRYPIPIPQRSRPIQQPSRPIPYLSHNSPDLSNSPTGLSLSHNLAAVWDDRSAATWGFTDSVHLNDLYWNLKHCPGTQPGFHLEFKVKRSSLAAQWIGPTGDGGGDVSFKFG